MSLTQEKIKRLKNYHSMSIRPVLIYHGKLDTTVASSDFFANKIKFSEILYKRF